MDSIQPKSGDFSTGICDCFTDVPSCVESFFCPYCQVGAQYNMVANGQTGINGLACCLPFCLDCCCGCGGLAWLATNCYVRCQVRKKSAIPASDCEDFCLGWLCPICLTCQNYRELTIRGNWPGGLCVSAPQKTMPMGSNSNDQGPVMGTQMHHQPSYQPQHNQ